MKFQTCQELLKYYFLGEGLFIFSTADDLTNYPQVNLDFIYISLDLQNQIPQTQNPVLQIPIYPQIYFQI